MPPPPLSPQPFNSVSFILRVSFPFWSPRCEVPRVWRGGKMLKKTRFFFIYGSFVFGISFIRKVPRRCHRRGERMQTFEEAYRIVRRVMFRISMFLVLGCKEGLLEVHRRGERMQTSKRAYRTKVI